MSRPPRVQTAGPAAPAPRLRFDRNELAGAFGDIGTDLPLLVGMALAARLDGTSVLVMFGLMQIVTALLYRLPMPVQPLKAMAAIVIAQQLPAGVLYGGGLAIGVLMLGLTLSGGIEWLARTVPKSVIRGVQFGLGLQLALLATTNYVRAGGVAGYGLALVALVLTLLLIGNRRYPAALFVVGLGLVYALLVRSDVEALWRSLGWHWPRPQIPSWREVLTGLVVLAVPQLPLSLGNSVLATRQLAEDLFPGRRVTVRKIGLTYSLMNLINPFFGGVPTCHGSGGMAGHYAFGGRTGGSVMIYGAMYLVVGLLFGAGFDRLIGIFPLPVLGVLLVFEGLAMMMLVRDLARSGPDLAIALLIGVVAAGLPYGYVVGLVAGSGIAYLAGGRLDLVVRRSGAEPAGTDRAGRGGRDSTGPGGAA